MLNSKIKIKEKKTILISVVCIELRINMVWYSGGDPTTVEEMRIKKKKVGGSKEGRRYIG